MSKDTTFLMALVHLIWIIEAFHTPNINGVTSNSRIHTKTIAQQLSKDDWFKLKHRATKLNLYNDEINEDENKAFRLNSGENGHFLKSTLPKVFGAVAATALSSFLLFSNVSNDPALYANAKATTEITQDNAQKEFEPPQITTTSSSTAIALGKTLQSLDAKMYGAYWCSHCYEQKQTLGKEVFSKDYVSYIECDKEGMNSKRSLCKERRVPGYPTWEIGGKLFPGEQSIEELQDLALEMKSALSIK